MSTEITATPGRGIAVPAAPPLGNTLQQLRGFAAQPAVAKSLPALAFIAVAGLVALLWMAISSPPSRDLFQGLPDGDKAAVVEALKGAGINYQLDRDTGAVAVSEDDYHQAKMLLAAQGCRRAHPAAPR
jgi:flagellar M-ring protein FliF